MKEQLLKILESEGLTPAKLADEIGVQRSSISHILSDRNKPSFDFILKILNRFSGINAEWLITGKGNMIKGESVIPKNVIQQELFQDNYLDNAKTKSTIKENINKTQDINNEKYNDILNTTQKDKNDNKTIHEVTNVNNMKFVLMFFEDGTFEKFSPRG
jgi:transcriptional regulator with XRE-family HTH domain